MQPRTGVLLTAHGTVEALSDIPAFLQVIRRGRPAPPSLVDEITHRYQLIGGSPLMSITREVAAKLEARLGLPVLIGMRLWGPTIEAAMVEARARGIERLVSLPLAPQSTHVYHDAAREAAARVEGAPSLVCVPPWGDEPSLIAAFSGAIDRGLASFDEGSRASVPVVLSAHSLPTRAIAAGDPYEGQFRAMAQALIDARREPARRFVVAFQSQGEGGGEWLGPDLKTTFEQLAAQGERACLVAAIGFVSDHVETLYDLDIEAPRLATAAGLERFARAPSLNADDAFVAALEAVVRRSVG